MSNMNMREYMSIKSAMKNMNPDEEGISALTEKQLRDVHNILLSAVEDIDRICCENNIHWVLGGGSALGAVRHGGFIPWDDDIDINMQRRDLEHFRRVFPGRFSDLYTFMYPGDPGYLFHFPRVYINGTTFREIQSTENGYNEMFIDIFPIENAPDGVFLRTIHQARSTFYLTVTSAARVEACKKTLTAYSRHNPKLAKEVRVRLFIAWLFRWRKMETWMRLADRTFSEIHNDRTHDVVIPTGAHHYDGEIYARKGLCESKRVKFESLMLPVPKDVRGYLKKMYGKDYMKIPDPDHREKHYLLEYELSEKVKRERCM